MNQNIKIYKNKEKLEYKSFIFNGGEVSVKLDAENYKWLKKHGNNEPVTIVARIQNSNDFFFLANIKNALEKIGEDNIHLFCPYLPYARQDRLCDKGESFSLKVFTNLLNSLSFKSVKVLDIHSDVGAALVDNLVHIDQLQMIHLNEDFGKRCLKNVVFISPDAGANKKTAKIAAYFNHSNFIRADKLRDLTNGKIKEIIVYCDDLQEQDVAIVDDLSEFGGTFMGLAAELKKKNAGKIILYVTHGLFPAGFDKLFESGINEIFTTNSFKEIDDPRVNVFNIESLI